MDLTIIIPTRNQDSRVVECVHALEHNQADIVVVDDASEDAVLFAPDSARVIRHNRRRGRSACINTGLKAAKHDVVLIIDDDIYAAPDMVLRLIDEFRARKNPKLGLSPRVTWDPDVPLTLTMRWMESAHKFPAPLLLSRTFIVENGGYDENFTHRLEDTELHIRLKQRGFAMDRLEAAVGFRSSVVKIRELAEHQFIEGVSAVSLHAKFPQSMPQVEDLGILVKNEVQSVDAAAAIDEIALIEQSGPSELSAGVADLYAHVCRHYFLHGIFEGLKDIGGTKPRRNSSSTIAIYRQASRLEEIEEFDEARRLFRLVLHRSDEKYWDGAEYHLGCIETALGNPEAAHFHFLECLRINPAHNKARRALYKPAHYREVASNIFEMLQPVSPAKVLFILFGDLSHVVAAAPVIAALRDKFNCEVAWLTSREYASFARATSGGKVHEAELFGVIPWDWIYEQSFTHVFFPEPGANLEEWEQSGLDATRFIARKCGIEMKELRMPRMRPNPNAVFEAIEFLKEHDLKQNGFITASHGSSEGRHWPNSNLMKLAQQTDLPVVVFGKQGDPVIPHTIPCPDKSFEVVAALIGWSSLYLGPSYGVSWLAMATETPMGIFVDPNEHHGRKGSFREVTQEQREIQEWSIYANVATVLDYMDARLFQVS